MRDAAVEFDRKAEAHSAAGSRIKSPRTKASKKEASSNALRTTSEDKKSKKEKKDKKEKKRKKEEASS